MVGVAPKHDIAVSAAMRDCSVTWNGLLDQVQNFREVSNDYTSKNRKKTGLKMPEFPLNKNSQ